MVSIVNLMKIKEKKFLDHNSVSISLHIGQKFLYAGLRNGNLALYALDSLNLFEILKCHDSTILDIAEDETNIYTVSSDGKTLALNKNQNYESLVLQEDATEITSLAINSKYVFTGNRAGKIFGINKKNMECEIQLNLGPNAIHCLMADERNLYAGPGTNSLVSWNINDFNDHYIIENPMGNNVTSMVQDRGFLYFGDYWGNVFKMNKKTKELIKFPLSQDYIIYHLSLVEDCLFSVCLEKNEVHLYDVNKVSHICKVDCAGSIYGMVANKNYLFCGLSDPIKIQIWDISGVFES